MLGKLGNKFTKPKRVQVKTIKQLLPYIKFLSYARVFWGYLEKRKGMILYIIEKTLVAVYR